MAADPPRLLGLELGDGVAASAEREQHEQRVAIHDLVERARLALRAHPQTPSHLTLRRTDDTLHLDFQDGARGAPQASLTLSLRAMSRHLKDYRMACDDYYMAVEAAEANAIEARDAMRARLHREGAAALRAKLATHANLNEEMAHSLFSLLASLPKQA